MTKIGDLFWRSTLKRGVDRNLEIPAAPVAISLDFTDVDWGEPDLYWPPQVVLSNGLAVLRGIARVTALHVTSAEIPLPDTADPFYSGRGWPGLALLSDFTDLVVSITVAGSGNPIMAFTRNDDDDFHADDRLFLSGTYSTLPFPAVEA